MIQTNQLERTQTTSEPRPQFMSEQQRAQRKLILDIKDCLIELAKNHSISLVDDDPVLEMLALSSLRDVLYHELSINSEEFRQRAQKRMLDFFSKRA